jgi:hypothetical protein
LSAENVTIDREKATRAVKTVLSARENRTGVFSRDLVIPEKLFIEQVKKLTVDIGDPRMPLNALFFVLAADFSRKSYDFYKKLENPEAIYEYYWLFQPENVASMVSCGLDVTTDILKYFGASRGYYGKAADGIVHNSLVLHHKYGDDIRNFLAFHNWDGAEIAEALIIRNRAKTEEKEYRRFGPKLTAYFIQQANHYDLADITNTEPVGLPVDIQLARFLVHAKAVDIKGDANVYRVIYKAASPIYKQIAEENNWPTQLISETIWLLGSNCCQYNRHSICPINEICDAKMPSGVYYRKGRFNNGVKWNKNYQPEVI